MKITFYGTRGSGPAEGNEFARYGGATTCVLLTEGKTKIMIDAGSGVSSALRDLDSSSELYLFITHPHLDHLSGIVTLIPYLKKGTVHIFGRSRGGLDIQEQIMRIMSPPIWPLTACQFENVTFCDIPEGSFEIGGITVKTMESSHPGGATLYRFESQKSGRSAVMAFDFNHSGGYGKMLTDFAMGADILVYDGNMNTAEHKLRSDWGHSTPAMGAKIAEETGSKLIVTHHGMFKSDAEIDGIIKEARKIHDDTYAAADGMSIEETENGMKIRTALNRGRDILSCLLDVGEMLSSEKDDDALLEKITRAAMYITGADAGTLYILEDSHLHFKIMITKSKNVFKGGKGDPIDLPPVPLKPENVCAAAVLEEKLINIPDAYDNDHYDFSGPRKYDAINGYKTTSILVVPMVNDRDDIIGVMQLINATDSRGKVIPFKSEDEKILSSIASQAAISLTNMNYSKQVTKLLNGFVKVMSTGIDARTPYNANHTKNMVRYCEKFLAYERQASGKWNIDDSMRRELLMSIWLHDIGKLITPLEIMDKNSRLGDGLESVENRFRRILLLNRLDYAEGKCTEKEFTDKNELIRNDLDFIRSINTAGFLADEKLAYLEEIRNRHFTDDDGTEVPYITEKEYTQLSIRKGTLTQEERNIMQGHVVMTSKMLSGLEFPKDYSEVPFWAGSHHEYLNGLGYPNHLKGEDIPWQVRLITILDVFEALTARDRPYKPPMPAEKAFGILDAMVRDCQVDAEILEEFKKSDAWEL